MREDGGDAALGNVRGKESRAATAFIHHPFLASNLWRGQRTDAVLCFSNAWVIPEVRSGSSPLRESSVQPGEERSARKTSLHPGETRKRPSRDLRETLARLGGNCRESLKGSCAGSNSSCAGSLPSLRRTKLILRRISPYSAQASAKPAQDEIHPAQGLRRLFAGSNSSCAGPKPSCAGPPQVFVGGMEAPAWPPARACWPPAARSGRAPRHATLQAFNSQLGRRYSGFFSTTAGWACPRISTASTVPGLASSGGRYARPIPAPRLGDGPPELSSPTGLPSCSTG